MGANDAAEMLEAARAECVRLERELKETKEDLAEARKILGYQAEAVPQIVAEVHMLRAKLPDVWDEACMAVLELANAEGIASVLPLPRNPYRTAEPGANQ